MKEPSTVAANDMDAPRLWAAVVEALNEKFLPYIIESWIAHIQPLSLSDGELVLQLPDTFTKEWVSKHYLKEIQTIINSVSDKKVTVALRVDNETAQPKKSGAGAAAAAVKLETAPRETEKNHFNSRYVFENFIIGQSNQFAHAACLAVSNSPSKAYNPLFLYGASGLGKTHLLHAIGQHILGKNKKFNVAYISTEEFTNQLIDAIKNKNTLKFRNKYRKIDVLLIDDIHFLCGKEQTQEEFFHTFNTLYSDHKQIVLTSDRSPKELKNMEDRLVSRFEWGLIADLQPPNMETRIAILRNKAERSGMKLDEEIISYIASNIKHNVRKLEGSLIRLISYSSLTGTPISLDLAKEILKDLIASEKEVEISIELIQKKTAEFFDIRIGDLKSDKRPKNIAVPRQIAMFLARTLTNSSLKEIGEAFGGKDHTTVIHAIKTIEKKMTKEEPLKKTVQQLGDLLKSRD